MVGAILADEAKPLPVDLRAFLEQGLAEGHGGVYVSMGTAARLTQQEMQSLSEALSTLPNPVLWKVSAVQLPSMLIFVVSTCFACCPGPCCCLWLECTARHAAAVIEVSAMLVYLAASLQLLCPNRPLTFSLPNAGWPVYRSSYLGVPNNSAYLVLWLCSALLLQLFLPCTLGHLGC